MDSRETNGEQCRLVAVHIDDVEQYYALEVSRRFTEYRVNPYIRFHKTLTEAVRVGKAPRLCCERGCPTRNRILSFLGLLWHRIPFGVSLTLTRHVRVTDRSCKRMVMMTLGRSLRDLLKEWRSRGP